jgi:hypothetical protein
MKLISYVDYRMIRRWVVRFGVAYATCPGAWGRDRTTGGIWMKYWFRSAIVARNRGITYPRCTVHAEGRVLEILVQWRRDKEAAIISCRRRPVNRSVPWLCLTLIL